MKNDNELIIAIPKGFLHEGSYKYFSNLGINFHSSDIEKNASRELIYFDKKNNVKGLLVRPNDVNVYVEHGSADLGVVGLDLLKEQIDRKSTRLNSSHSSIS